MIQCVQRSWQCTSGSLMLHFVEDQMVQGWFLIEKLRRTDQHRVAKISSISSASDGDSLATAKLYKISSWPTY